MGTVLQRICRETGARDNCKGSKLTVFRVELQPVVDPSNLNYAYSHRHTFGQPRRIEAAADGQPIFSAFAAAPPEWLNIRRCNRLRLTGRGLACHGESFEIGTAIEAIAIRYR